MKPTLKNPNPTPAQLDRLAKELELDAPAKLTFRPIPPQAISDPLAGFFLGIRFRGEKERQEAIRRVHAHVSAERNRWETIQKEYGTIRERARNREVQDLQAAITKLEHSIRQIKRDHAEELIQAMRVVPEFGHAAEVDHGE